MFFESNQPGLTALLKQASEIVRWHFSFRTSLAMKVAARTFVDEKTAWNLDFEDRLQCSCVVRQLYAKSAKYDGRLDTLLANLENIALSCI